MKGREQLKGGKQRIRVSAGVVCILQAVVHERSSATIPIIELNRIEVMAPISTRRVCGGVSVESPGVRCDIPYSGSPIGSEAGELAEELPMGFLGIEVEEGGYLPYTLESNSRHHAMPVHCPASGYRGRTLRVLVDPPGNAGSKLTVPDNLGSTVVGNDGKSGYLTVSAGSAQEGVRSVLSCDGSTGETQGRGIGCV